MSRKRKYRKPYYPWGMGLDRRQARRLCRRLARVEVWCPCPDEYLTSRFWEIHRLMPQDKP